MCDRFIEIYSISKYLRGVYGFAPHRLFAGFDSGD